jgi:methylated-DNA-[protein]-cysteine S-methyltransferase
MVTPIGELLVFSIGDRIIAIEFLDRGHAEARIRRFMPGVAFVDGPIPAPALSALRTYFDTGKCDAFDDLPIEPFGSPFQLRVWEELRKIPSGAITSYGAIAKAIGRPNASRAIGAVNGQNPIPIIIPCHRVVGTDRSLTGYGSGLDRKAWLLVREGVDLNRGENSVQGELPWAV